MELFQVIYSSVIQEIKHCTSIKQFYETFNELQDDISRIQYIRHYSSSLIRTIDGCIADNSSISVKFNKQAFNWKEQGNNLFKQRKYFAALKHYNKAILFCETQLGTQEISLCYANRSAALYHIGHHEECVRDICQAIEFGYSPYTLWKLLIRKAKCFQFVRGVTHLQEAIEAATTSLHLSNLSDDGKKLQLNELKNLSARKNPTLGNVDSSMRANQAVDGKFPALTLLVSVDYSTDFGNLIISKTEIKTGDLILREKPFSSVTLGAFYETHCFNCQTYCVYSAVPCDSCSLVVYCSINCRSYGWNLYHKYECKNIAKLKSVGINMGHLSLRAALQAGYQLLADISRMGANVGSSMPYQSDEYVNIALLQGHTDERSAVDLFWRTLAAVVLVRLVDLSDWSDAEDKEILLTAYTLHNLQVFPCNAHEISELAYDTSEPCRSETLGVGAGIYATLSFFNHSCDPTVVRTFCNGNECHVTALSPLSKGEQVFDNYGTVYAVQSMEERREKLSTQYYFECTCLACVQNWPSYASMDYFSLPMFKCPKCSALITDDQCCGGKFDISLALNQLSQAKSLFDQELTRLFQPATLLSRRKSESKAKLCAYSDLVDRLVFRPFRTLNDCQEALKHMLACDANCHETGT